MKKFLKIVYAIICWIISIALIYGIISEWKYLDPWGLGFAFVIIPMGIMSIIFMVGAIALTKQLIGKDKDNK